MGPAGTTLPGEDLVWALGVIAQLCRIPFDAQLARQQLAPPYAPQRLEDAAAKLGAKARWRNARAAALAKIDLPCLALLTGDSTATEAADDAASVPHDPKVTPLPNLLRQRRPAQAPAASHRLVLIVQANDEAVSFLAAGESNVASLSAVEFSAVFAGAVLHCKRAPAKVEDEQVAARPFGFSWFIPELLKHKRIWRDVLLASLVMQLMALAIPLCTQVVIDKVVVHQTVNTLIVIAVAMLVFMAFTAVLSYARQYLILHTGNRVDAVLGSQVFEHLLRLPLPYYQYRSTGVVVARVHGVETIRQFLSSAAVTLLLDCPFLLIFLGIMFWYSWLLSLIALAVLVLMVGLTFAVAPAFRRRLNHQFLLGARNQAFLTEYLSGIETVKSLQMEPQLKGRFDDYLARYLDAGFSARQLANGYTVLANTLEQLLSLLILCIGAALVMQNAGFTIGMLVAFQMFVTRLSQPMLRIAGLWQEFQQAAIAVKRLGDVMDAPQEPYSLVPSREPIRRGRIELKNLSFRYADNLPYLYQHLNLTIEPGECVAIMGPSGCGKSTLAKLLQGFYQPSEGAISLDGHDIRYLSANELRSAFGVVPQDTVLFSGTIYDNLVLGNAQADL
ncbi:MAG TPA: peptidase domain-containing ABC transporter, partial [Burkholderiales bacterium]|nr:peptidase domain-containing ABC transporter [Burkholderiales bacterium]